MSDTNRVALGFVEESTFGVTPTSPAFETLRFTNGGLTFTPRTITSNEIRPDRQVSDLILVGAEAAGELGFELSYGAFDTLLQAALFSTWAAKPTIVNATADSSITDAGTTADTYAVASGGAAFKVGHLVRASGFANAGNNKVFRVSSSTATTIVGTSLALAAETAPPAGARLQVVGFQGASGDIAAVTAGGNGLTATALDFTTLGLAVGEWIKIGGAAAVDRFATAACNGWARISAIAAGKLTFDVVPTGWAADTGTGKTIRCFAGDYLRNGTTKRSFSIERQYQDHSPVTYEYFRGMHVAELALTLDAQAIVTGTARFMGKDAVVQDSGRFAGASDIAAATNSVLNTSSNVGRIAEGGADVTGPNYVLAAAINLNNNLRAQNAIGSLGAVGVGVGEFNVSGRLNTYFGNKTLYQKVLDNTATSYDVRVTRADANGQTLLFDLPRLKFSGGSPAVQGKNQDVTVDLAFQAFRHETLGYTMHVARYAYVE